MRKFFLLGLRAYSYLVSPLLGTNCRFYPSCSSYAYQAVEEFGIWRGSYLALRRLARCHPWHPGGYDPVPPGSNSKCCELDNPAHSPAKCRS